MPKPPGLIDRVNYVVKFIEDPCHAPWTVYAETALESLGTMFMAYLTPSPADVLRFYIKPRSARSQGKFLASAEDEELAEEGLQLLPDINELVGTRLPFAAELAESAVHSRIAWFWVIDGVLERILWYWLLVEMISEFAFDWTTAVNASEACSVDRGGSALLQRDEQFIAFAGIQHLIEPMVVRKSWGAVQGTTNGIIFFHGITGTVIGGMAVVATPFVSSVTVRLIDTTSGDTVHAHTMDFSMDPSVAQSTLLKAQAIPDHGYALTVQYAISSTDAMGVFCSNINLNGFGESTASGLPMEI